MNFFTTLLLLFMGRGKEPSMISRITALMFLFFCACVVIYIGAKVGFGAMIIFGVVWAIAIAVIIAILIVYNIYRNSPRW